MLSPSVFLGNNLVSIPKAARFWSLLLLSTKRNQGSMESDYYSMFRAEKAEMLENLTNLKKQKHLQGSLGFPLARLWEPEHWKGKNILWHDWATELNWKGTRRDFLNGSVAQTPCSQYRGPDSTPGQGLRSHMPQPRVRMPQLERSHMLQLRLDVVK